MICQDRQEEILRLTRIRIYASLALHAVRDCAFPSCGRLPRGSRRARAAITGHAHPKVNGRPARASIIQGTLVTDQRGAYDLLLTVFSALAELHKAEECDDLHLAAVTKFMNALDRGRSLTSPAKVLCKSLRDTYGIDEKGNVELEPRDEDPAGPWRVLRRHPLLSRRRCL